MLETFLDLRGTKAERRFGRRYLMRSVLCRPEVRAAIEELLASHGLTRSDVVDLHIAHIRGTFETVRFTRDGKFVIIKAPICYDAMRDYWKMIGWLR